MKGKVTEPYVKAKSMELSPSRKAEEEVLRYYPKPMDQYRVYKHRLFPLSGAR
jgi:hypothetical protein